MVWLHTCIQDIRGFLRPSNFFDMILESIDRYKSITEEIRSPALLVINVRSKYMAQMYAKWAF